MEKRWQLDVAHPKKKASIGCLFFVIFYNDFYDKPRLRKSNRKYWRNHANLCPNLYNVAENPPCFSGGMKCDYFLSLTRFLFSCKI